MIGRMPHTPPEDGVPPAEVRILTLRVDPWPDGKRVRVFMTLTPFLERPNIDVAIAGAAGGKEIAALTIVENMDDAINFTMHLKQPDASGDYKLFAAVRYAEPGIVSRQELAFHIEPASSLPQESAGG